MLAKKQISQRLERPTEGASPADFLDMHLHTEAYLKHLLFTGVRKAFRAEYGLARTILNRAAIPYNDSSFVHAFRMLDIGIDWTRLKRTNAVVYNLSRLSYFYVARVRNAVLHGAYYAYQEGEPALLMQIDQAFVKAVEGQIAGATGGKAILQNPPRAFGAEKGIKSTEQELSRKVYFSLGQKPWKMEKAESIFAALDVRSE